MQSAADVCRGRWVAILTEFEVSPTFLTDRHGPCPICGGKDRFRFDDKDGKGTWICTHCGAGDGFALLMKLHGWGFKMTRDKVVPFAMSVQPAAVRKAMGDGAIKRLVENMWNASVPITVGDAAFLHLKRRGLSPDTEELRFLESCKWQERGADARWMPAMIARVTDDEGNMVTLHRTYLKTNGEKADVPEPRKLMPGRIPSSAAIRLYRPDDGRLGVAEGIETAMSARLRFGRAVWALINSSRMIQFPIPQVDDLAIFGDNDLSFTGQLSAYNLAYRAATMTGRKPVIRVAIPPSAGDDWNDVWLKCR